MSKLIMEKELLIKALRNCSSAEGSCAECSYKSRVYPGTCNGCKWDMIRDAADALEAAEKRIAELMPKEGEWIVDKNGYPQIICSICDVHIPMVAGWCMDAHIKYCPNCGARMRTVTDCHTLDER